MAVEIYDIDAVKSQLGEVLDEFIVDVRSVPLPVCSVRCVCGVCVVCVCVCVCVCVYSQRLPKLPEKDVTKLDRQRRDVRMKELVCVCV